VAEEDVAGLQLLDVGVGSGSKVFVALGALQDEDAEARRSAAQALGSLKDPAAIKPLISLIDDENAGVRYHAIFSLMQLEAREAIDPLMGVLAKEKEDLGVRHVAAQALGTVRATQAVPLLIEALEEKDEIKDDNWNVRLAAAWAFMHIKDHRAVEPLISILDGPFSTWQERSAAASALGHQGDPKAIEPLIRSLPRFVHGHPYWGHGEKDLRVQNSASWALTHVGQPAVGPLIEALGRGTPHVRASVAWALEWITNQRFGTDQAKWHEWWRAQEDVP